MSLSARSLLSVESLREIIRKPDRPIHYLTAVRLVRASEGAITLEALSRRGAFIGSGMFDGPLGERIAQISADGDTYSMRLVRAGIRRNYMVEMLNRGAMPREAMFARLAQAFPGITIDDVREHASWRATHLAVDEDDGGMENEAESERV